MPRKTKAFYLQYNSFHQYFLETYNQKASDNYGLLIKIYTIVYMGDVLGSKTLPYRCFADLNLC